MMKQYLALLLALAFSLSGCLGFLEGDPESDEEDTTGTGGENSGAGTEDGNGDGNQTGGESNGNDTANQPPEASLDVDLKSGEAPLNVTFTLDGSDPDGDDLTWSLDLGDGSDPIEGAELPAEVEYSYTEPGNFTVTLEVSDGTATATDHVNLTVEAPGEVQEYSGGWMITNPVYCELVGPVHTELLGIFTDGTSVDPATVGAPFKATFETDMEDAILEYIVAFIDRDDGFDIAEIFRGAPGAPITGTVPESADSVYFAACGVSGSVEVEYVAG